MTRHMACSESSYWLAERAVVRSCSKPRKLASGRARERTGQTPTGADLFEHPATVMLQQWRGLRCPRPRPAQWPARLSTRRSAAEIAALSSDSLHALLDDANIAY